MDLTKLTLLSKSLSRSISPENFTGEKGYGGMATEGTGSGPARDLGRGWKVSPSIVIRPGETVDLANIQGPGTIQHIWITITGNWRFGIFRAYWDRQEQASIEVPVGDFFLCGWGCYAPVASLPICVNPGSAFNSYWQMPFRQWARLTIENISAEPIVLYYQIDYALEPVSTDAAYFHAQFRRTNPLLYGSVYTILDNVRGRGHYVGTYLAWGSNNNGWWGEGEIKFYLDGDGEFPTICGTGTEDYICGSYNFDPSPKHNGGYVPFTNPYTGLHQVLRPAGDYQSQMRFGMYRWHLLDPVRFDNDLRVTIQALGWRSGGRYLPLQDDIASVAYWYQSLPTSEFPVLPDRDDLEVI